jgi:hypothetical protein
MTADWGIVYMQERKRPGYVIDNGKSIARVYGPDDQKRKVKMPQHGKKRAA